MLNYLYLCLEMVLEKEYKALNNLIFNVLNLFLKMVRKVMNSSTMIYEPII